MFSNKKHYLIAEIGGNHEGDLRIAKGLIRSAAEAGADAVKFQSYTAKGLVNKCLDPTRFAHFKGFELSCDGWNELVLCARENGVEFATSIWDIKNFGFLLDELPFIKVGSGDLTNFSILKHFALTRKPIILSTAMASITEIDRAVQCIQNVDSMYNLGSNLCIMHCVAMYGNPRSEYANLRQIETLKKMYPNLEIGYSDHSIGYNAMLIANVLGVRIFEFHFTFDKSREFRDHQISLNSRDLVEFKQSLNFQESVLGNSCVRPVVEVESPQRVQEFRRACYFKRKMKKGQIVKEEDLIYLRPNVGLCASEYESIISKECLVDIDSFEPISINQFK